MADNFWKHSMYSSYFTETSRANVLFTSEVRYLRLWAQQNSLNHKEISKLVGFGIHHVKSTFLLERYLQLNSSVSLLGSQKCFPALPCSTQVLKSNTFLRLIPRFRVWIQVSYVQRVNFPHYSDFTSWFIRKY